MFRTIPVRRMSIPGRSSSFKRSDWSALPLSVHIRNSQTDRKCFSTSLEMFAFRGLLTSPLSHEYALNEGRSVLVVDEDAGKLLRGISDRLTAIEAHDRELAKAWEANVNRFLAAF